MNKTIVSLVSLVTLVASMYAQHTHRTHTLTREQKVVAITILAEARGEGNAGMYAVAAVIAQRAFERKRTPEGVCLKPYQFSCWNGGRIDQLLAKAKRHPRFNEALAIVNGTATNYTGGADHYHADYCNPYWASSMKKTCIIGKHLFYK